MATLVEKAKLGLPERNFKKTNLEFIQENVPMGAFLSKALSPG